MTTSVCRDSLSQSLSVSSFVQSLACHPEVAQCKQCRDLRGVLHQPPVPGLRIAKLLLEHAERMFNLGADARFQAFNLVEYRVQSDAVPAGLPAERRRRIEVSSDDNVRVVVWLRDNVPEGSLMKDLHTGCARAIEGYSSHQGVGEHRDVWAVQVWK